MHTYLQSKYGDSQNDYTLLNWNQYAHASLYVSLVDTSLVCVIS